MLKPEPASPQCGCLRHVAIIMDGNGRWAQARRLPRLEGHRRGVEGVREIMRACVDFGIEYLTLFAFSTENWKRSREEVFGLMDLFRAYMKREAANLVKDGVRVRFIGDRAQLAVDLRTQMAMLERKTAANTRLTVVVGLNYGGRADVAKAARRLAESVERGEIRARDVSEDVLERELSTREIPDPDLLIRTSGEYRISNFLLWQTAYSEFMFVDEYWPDFDRAALERALDQFHLRERRFGTVAG